MLNKQNIIETIIKEFPKLREEYHVHRVGLFGSYVQNSANENSDIDLIIEFGEPIGLQFIQLCDYMEKLFDKKVDILTPEGLKNIRIKSVVENILNTIEYVDAA
jgi:predicted nucleotidyltransferase